MTPVAEKVRVFSYKVPDQWGGTVLGYDIQILNREATVNDYLDALAAFCGAILVDCRGCDGCCHERAPMTAIDAEWLVALLPAGKPRYPYHAVVSAFGQCIVGPDGAVDIILNRRQGACVFLHPTGKFCRIHSRRPFVCRSHFCLPHSERAEALRGAVVNAGEDSLVRLLLEEESRGAPPILSGVQARDYPLNATWEKHSYAKIRLQEICNPLLWQELLAE